MVAATSFLTMLIIAGAVGAPGVFIVPLMGVFDFVGTVGSGWLSERHDNRWLLFWYYGLRGLSLALLPLTDFSIYGLTIFAVFYGLDWIATVPPTVKLAITHFGPAQASIVFGWVFAGHPLGAATAACDTGFSRVQFESYLPAFVIAGLLRLLAALLILTLPPAGAKAERPPMPRAATA